MSVCVCVKEKRGKRDRVCQGREGKEDSSNQHGSRFHPEPDVEEELVEQVQGGLGVCEPGAGAEQERVDRDAGNQQLPRHAQVACEGGPKRSSWRSEREGLGAKYGPMNK